MFGDLFSCFCGLPGKGLYFGRHNGKPLACFTAPRSFDRYIEREQVGLPRDSLNEAGPADRISASTTASGQKTRQTDD